jgi:hypothetical protein
MRFYRLTLLVSTVAWFMIGLHVPALHQITHHGAAPSVSVLVAMAVLAGVAVLGLWVLLRAPVQARQQ